MIESVKKAQQETSAALLSRALQMCRAKQVRFYNTCPKDITLIIGHETRLKNIV